MVTYRKYKKLQAELRRALDRALVAERQAEGLYYQLEKTDGVLASCRLEAARSISGTVTAYERQIAELIREREELREALQRETRLKNAAERERFRLIGERDALAAKAGAEI